MFKLLTLMAMVVTTTTIASASPTPTADTHSDEVPARAARVRAADARTAVLLMQGLERSETIRSLVNRIEQHNVIVYLEMQPTLKKRLAGSMTWISAAGNYRYVKLSINPELGTDVAIATLGHELQHALEVAQAPQIVNEQTLSAYYRLHGDGSRAESNGWDTEAARLVGDFVRRELASVRIVRVADSTQQPEPQDWFNVYRRARSMLPP
jgi:hypothetical protein